MSKVWDARTGRELVGAPIPPMPRPGEISPDGRWIANILGNNPPGSATMRVGLWFATLGDQKRTTNGACAWPERLAGSIRKMAPSSIR